MASSRAGVGVQIDRPQADRPPLVVEEKVLRVEDIAGDAHPLPAEPAGDLVEDAVERDHVVVRDETLLPGEELPAEILPIVVGSERTVVGEEARLGRLLAEAAVGLPVVVVLQVVREPQLQRHAVGIDVVGGQVPQNRVLGRPVEPLDLASARRVGDRSVHDADVEVGEHGVAVVGGEPRTVVVVEDIHLADALENPVQAPEEQHRGLAGPDDDLGHVATGVIDEEDGNPAQPLAASAEVLAVAQHDLHAVLLGEPALVDRRGPPRPGPHAQPLQRTPSRGAVDILGPLQQPGVHGPSQQLWNAGTAIRPLLGGEERDEAGVENVRCRRRAQRGRQPLDPA